MPPNSERGGKCPNPRCISHSRFVPYVHPEWGNTLKDIAIIMDDMLPGIESNGAAIVFKLCWSCHTVHAEYAID